MLHITALMDNKLTEHKALIAEHGLSLYLCYNGRRILFDCGSGPNPIENARKLGISLSGLDAVVLSHSHYDHAAGFRFLTEQGLGSGQVYTGPTFFEPKYAHSGMRYTNLSAGFDRAFLEEHGIVHRQVDGLLEIFPGAYLVSGFPRVESMETIPDRFVRLTETGFVPDDFCDEVCLALEVEGGLAVLVGCSHPGILNMVRHIYTLLGKPVRAVFGGTHLVEADSRRIEGTIDALHALGVEVLGLSHCSGDGADCAICARTDVQGCHLGSGDSVFFD